MPAVVLSDRMACLKTGVVANVVVPHPEYVQFATFYGLEVDFPYLEAVNISVGRQIYFTDAQMHGSATRANVYVGPGASVVS